MRFRNELVGGTTSTLILSILSRASSHGYELVQRANEESGGLFEWKEGTIYPILHRLEKAGQISGAWKETSNGKKRRVYSLTAKGKKVLGERAEEWNLYSGAVNRIMGVSRA